MTKKTHVPPETLDRLANHSGELVDALNRIDDLETALSKANRGIQDLKIAGRACLREQQPTSMAALDAAEALAALI